MSHETSHDLDSMPTMPPRAQPQGAGADSVPTMDPRWRTAAEWSGRRWKAGEAILDRYVVESELGQGGMGVVYGCLDKVGGVRVAVKALPPELSRNAGEMEEIRENFQLVYRLGHPNIAGARTLEQDANGEFFLVMELAEGESLRRWMRRKWRAGGIAFGEAVPILRQVASALDYAHELKVVHRDVKPENVMIDGRGRVKVLDFGLAEQIRSSLSRVSQEFGGTSGTRPYMAPEQWEGKRQDARTDQYALGVMAYEMLSGFVPFNGSDTGVLREAVLHGEPDPVEGLGEAAMAALRRALAKTRTERWPSCVAFVEALEKGTDADVKPQPPWAPGKPGIPEAGTRASLKKNNLETVLAFAKSFPVRGDEGLEELEKAGWLLAAGTKEMEKGRDVVALDFFAQADSALIEWKKKVYGVRERTMPLETGPRAPKSIEAVQLNVVRAKDLRRRRRTAKLKLLALCLVFVPLVMGCGVLVFGVIEAIANNPSECLVMVPLALIVFWITNAVRCRINTLQLFLRETRQ